MRPVQMVAVVLIAQTMAGCSGSAIGPSGPNETTAITTATPKSPRVSDGPKPTISAISPGTGSMYGGSWVIVVGEFDRSATVTIGGIHVSTYWNPKDATRHSFVSPRMTPDPPTSL
jgi:hypothetical protein